MKKTVTVILSVIIAAAVILTSVVYYFFFDISHLQGEKLIAKSVSPDNKYTVEVYLNSGSATTNSAVLCRLHYNDESGKDRNIYWDYNCTDANIEWTDNDTVVINGKTIDDVTKDKYDWRND
ncbi:MAG: hypothetical protein IKN26_05915 [Eubacterium sp.]|nr:hypothetical protein [Eubacterium sp.]MBR4241179.1 hypothetical protein [Eubacterium sp.]